MPALIDPSNIFFLLTMVSMLLLMLIAERIRPARPLPFYPGWLWLGISVMVFFVALANSWSLVIPKDWLRQHRLFDGEFLGVWGGVTVWYVFNTFFTYWYHRFQHGFSLAWRMLHQVHHGVPRVDIPSAFMAHPCDVIVSTTFSILVTAFLLGLDARAVSVASVIQFFITLFPHWNVRTPNWVGYFVQRPEEHILHHQRGVHAGNYSDWPVWDKVFGTYRTPSDEPVQVGYEREGFAEQLKMLVFVDINSPSYAD